VLAVRRVVIGPVSSAGDELWDAVDRMAGVQSGPARNHACLAVILSVRRWGNAFSGHILRREIALHREVDAAGGVRDWSRGRHYFGRSSAVVLRLPVCSPGLTPAEFFGLGSGSGLWLHLIVAEAWIYWTTRAEGRETR